MELPRIMPRLAALANSPLFISAFTFSLRKKRRRSASLSEQKLRRKTEKRPIPGERPRVCSASVSDAVPSRRDGLQSRLRGR